MVLTWAINKDSGEPAHLQNTKRIDFTGGEKKETKKKKRQ